MRLMMDFESEEIDAGDAAAKVGRDATGDCGPARREVRGDLASTRSALSKSTTTKSSLSPFPHSRWASER